MLRSAVLFQNLEAFASPGFVGGNAEPLSNDTIDISPQDELVHCELFLRAQDRRCLVADLEDGGAGNRFLVVFYLVFDVQLVFVL